MKKIIISSDFETVKVDLNNQKRHFIFIIGLMFEIKNKIKYKVFKLNKINKKNIIKEEEKLIKEYINFLLNINKIYSLNKKTKLYIYFHNLGGFDGIFISNYISKNLEEFYKKKSKIIIRNSRIYKIKINNITFLDSFHIIPMSLNNISNIILKEKKIDFKKINEITIKEINNEIYNKEINNYLYKDVELLYKIINKIFIIINNKFNIELYNHTTISSLAFKIFNDKYNKKDICWNNDFNTYNYIKEAYHGGITNVFKPIGENIYGYDINSLYPSVMKDQYMPVGEPVWEKKPKNIDINKFFGFIRLKIKINQNQYIPPIITKNKNKLILFTGEKIITIFSEELLFALKEKRCEIIEIYSAVKFEKKKIFTEYVDDIYSLRIKSKTKAENLLYKLLLNSLYGRFGMKLDFLHTLILSQKELNILEDNKIKIKSYITNEFNDYVMINIESNENTLSRFIKNDEIDKIIRTPLKKISKIKIAIQISAAITSYSRIKLLKNIYNIGENNIYYCDTDSIFTDKKIDDSLISNELGYFKMEYEKSKCIFLSPKTYIIKNEKEEIKFKGLPLEEKKKLNWNWFKNIYNKINKKKETSFKLNIPIKKNIKDLIISYIENKKYSIYWNFDKREKIFKNNKWIDTKPINLNKK